MPYQIGGGRVYDYLFLLMVLYVFKKGQRENLNE